MGVDGSRGSHIALLELTKRAQTRRGEIAFDVLGSGPPVLLVHGTPSRALIWRQVAPVLAERHQVYVFDLLGFGASQRHVDQDVSLAAHAQVLAELTEQWELDRPAVVGHDIGGGVVLRAHLVEGVAFDRIALIDAVVLTPWITPRTRKMQEGVESYFPLPNDELEATIEEHLRGATHRELDPDVYNALFGQWSGEDGQALYLRNLAQLDERHTAEFEPQLRHLEPPLLLVWGEHDRWIDVSVSERIAELVPGSRRTVIADAGHFSMEDDPAAVARALSDFLG
jgi:pimeloyl-ACP methyl ester carboxylesterase